MLNPVQMSCLLSGTHMSLPLFFLGHDLLSASMYRQVFGRSIGAPLPSSHRDNSSVSKLAAQRLARESDNN